MTGDKDPSTEVSINIGDPGSLVNVAKVHVNTDQEVIVTTEDRLKNLLSNYSNSLENKNGWIPPLGIFATLLFSLTSVDFKKVLGLSADTWQAIFIIAGISSLAWLIHSIIVAVQSWQSPDIVEELKKDSTPQPNVGSSNTTISSSQSPDIPELSKRAALLLLEANKDMEGQIKVVESLDSLEVETHSRRFVSQPDPLTRERWIEVIKELQNKFLIEKTGDMTYSVTAEGYVVADLLSKK